MTRSRTGAVLIETYWNVKVSIIFNTGTLDDKY
mgnify:CR=1 FL=1